MSGLLRKDLELMKINKKFSVVVILMCFVMAYAGSAQGFVQMYLPLMAGFLIMSTLSYDEYDNGMAYLMALPVVRSSYAKEKYVFSLLLAGGGCVLGTLIEVLLKLLGISKNAGSLEEIGATFLASIIVTGIFIALVIPLQLKFGPEKGRLAISVVFIGAFGIFLLLGQFKEYLPVADSLEKVGDFLETAGLITVGTGIIVFTAVILLVSCLLSIRIMEKKEF